MCKNLIIKTRLTSIWPCGLFSDMLTMWFAVAFSSFCTLTSVASEQFKLTTVQDDSNGDRMVRYLLDFIVLPTKSQPNEFSIDFRPVYMRFFPKGYQHILINEEEKSESRQMLVSWITATFFNRISIEMQVIPTNDQLRTGLLDLSLEDCDNMTSASCHTMFSLNSSEITPVNISSLFSKTWQSPIQAVVRISDKNNSDVKVDSIAVHLEILAGIRAIKKAFKVRVSVCDGVIR